MTIHLTLDPVVEQKLAAAAAAQGLRPEEYVSQVVVEAVTRKSPQDSKQKDAILSMLDRLALHPGVDIPAGETYSREMIYVDQPKVP